jgi:hypothetical protein
LNALRNIRLETYFLIFSWYNIEVIILKEKKATAGQIKKMSKAYGNYIKVVIDIEKEILSGGSEFHYEDEQYLLEYGCNQSNLWGGGVDMNTKQIDYNSMINVRSNQDNPSRDILSPEIRKKFDTIIRKLLI